MKGADRTPPTRTARIDDRSRSSTKRPWRLAGPLAIMLFAPLSAQAEPPLSGEPTACNALCAAWMRGHTSEIIAVIEGGDLNATPPSARRGDERDGVRSSGIPGPWRRRGPMAAGPAAHFPASDRAEPRARNAPAAGGPAVVLPPPAPKRRVKDEAAARREAAKPGAVRFDARRAPQPAVSPRQLPHDDGPERFPPYVAPVATLGIASPATQGDRHQDLALPPSAGRDSPLAALLKALPDLSHPAPVAPATGASDAQRRSSPVPSARPEAVAVSSEQGPAAASVPTRVEAEASAPSSPGTAAEWASPGTPAVSRDAVEASGAGMLDRHSGLVRTALVLSLLALLLSTVGVPQRLGRFARHDGD